jgi:hypothetical protein
MKASLVTPEMIAAFGKKPTRLATGASSGIRKRDWDRLIRGEDAPVEEEIVRGPARPLHLRAGYGDAR